MELLQLFFFFFGLHFGFCEMGLLGFSIFYLVLFFGIRFCCSMFATLCDFWFFFCVFGLYELLRNEANVGFLGLTVYFEGCSVHFSSYSKLLSIEIFQQSNWLRRRYCIKIWTLCTWIARIRLTFEKIQFFNSMNRVLLTGLGFKVIK